LLFPSPYTAKLSGVLSSSQFQQLQRQANALHEIIKLFFSLLLQDSSAIQKRRIPWQNVADGNNNRLLEDS
jgi:flagellar biosynthesis chaperone FliJ